MVGDSEIKSMSLKSSRTLTDAVSSVDKIEKLLTRLNPNKSCGPNESHPRLLKETASILSNPIHDLFTKSLENGLMPSLASGKMLMLLVFIKRGTSHRLVIIDLSVRSQFYVKLWRKLLEKL